MAAGVDGDVRVDDAQVGSVAAHHERLVIRGVAHIRVAGDLEIARGGGNGGAFGIIVTHGLSLRLFESLLKSLLQKLFFVFPPATENRNAPFHTKTQNIFENGFLPVKFKNKLSPPDDDF